MEYHHDHLPAFSLRFATSSAAQVAAPEEIPTADLPRAQPASRLECVVILHTYDLIIDLGY